MEMYYDKIILVDTWKINFNPILFNTGTNINWIMPIHPNRKLYEKYKKLYEEGYTRREITKRLRLYPWGELRLYSDMLEERISGVFSPYTQHERIPISF